MRERALRRAFVAGRSIFLTKLTFRCRGLHSHHFISELVEWEMSTDPKFKEKYYRPSKVLEHGDWGRRIQIFFDGLELKYNIDV